MKGYAEQEMKRRNVIYCFIMLYLAAIFVLINYSADIRNLFSPTVVYDVPQSVVHDGNVFFILPDDTIYEYIDGNTYIWSIQSCDRYREKSYMAEKYQIDIVKINNDNCVKWASAVSRVIVETSDELQSGMLINCSKKGE